MFQSAPTSSNIYFAPTAPSSASISDRRASVFGYEVHGGVRLDLRRDDVGADSRCLSTPVDGQQQYQTISKSTTAGREYSHIELLPQTIGEENDRNRNYHMNVS